MQTGFAHFALCFRKEAVPPIIAFLFVFKPRTRELRDCGDIHCSHPKRRRIGGDQNFTAEGAEKRKVLESKIQLAGVSRRLQSLITHAGRRTLSEIERYSEHACYPVETQVWLLDARVGDVQIPRFKTDGNVACNEVLQSSASLNIELKCSGQVGGADASSSYPDSRIDEWHPPSSSCEIVTEMRRQPNNPFCAGRKLCAAE